MTLDDWDERDQEAALREGWIFSEASNGELQVQRVDDPDKQTTSGQFVIPVLSEDAQAWRVVWFGTEPHHEKARQILKDTNPSDWVPMLNYFQTLKGNAS